MPTWYLLVVRGSEGDCAYTTAAEGMLALRALASSCACTLHSCVNCRLLVVLSTWYVVQQQYVFHWNVHVRMFRKGYSTAQCCVHESAIDFNLVFFPIAVGAGADAGAGAGAVG